MCPKCKWEIEKEPGDCTRMKCRRCGTWFCYYCGGGPYPTSKKVYRHIRTQHGGPYVQPPDYKRHFLNDSSVTDEEIAKFYELYPQLRPIGYAQ